MVIGHCIKKLVSQNLCFNLLKKDLDVTTAFSQNKTDSDGTITPSKPKVYKVYTDLGEMTIDEIATLSETTREACKEKAIHKTKVEEIDENTFNQLKNDESITTSRASNFITRQSTCTDRKV